MQDYANPEMPSYFGMANDTHPTNANGNALILKKNYIIVLCPSILRQDICTRHLFACSICIFHLSVDIIVYI